MVHRINKRKLWLYSAIAANLGISGYLLHKYLKKSKGVYSNNKPGIITFGDDMSKAISAKQMGGKQVGGSSKPSISKKGIFDLIKNKDTKGLLQLAKSKQNLIAVLLGLGLTGGFLYKKIRDKIRQAKIEEGLPQSINGGSKSKTTSKSNRLTKRTTLKRTTSRSRRLLT